MALFATPHESGCGTFRTCRAGLTMSAPEGKAEEDRPRDRLPILTQLRHWPHPAAMLSNPGFSPYQHQRTCLNR
jgi:hypothetical protein